MIVRQRRAEVGSEFVGGLVQLSFCRLLFDMNQRGKAGKVQVDSRARGVECGEGNLVAFGGQAGDKSNDAQQKVVSTM